MSVRRTVEAMLVVAVLLDVAYWTLWFTRRGWIASEHTRAYYAFENAFPVADLWLGVACVLALVTLRRRSPAALLWLLCAGAAGLYLFGMDLLYDVEHDIFSRGAVGAVEAGIVTLTLVFSLVALRWAWSHREELLAGDDA